MRTISLKLPDYLYEQLDDFVSDKNINKSDLIRNALRNFLTQKVYKPKQASFLDKASDLSGCIKDGPDDLSSNPKYMEGFGE